MKLKQLAFLGDSFTWGEGLELYLDTPFWINQRKKRSIWTDIVDLQTEQSTNFREKNRFANIVANYFDSDLIIDNSNGGWIGNITYYLQHILESNLKPDYVIIQFSCFIRNPIHYHFNSLYRKCKCGRCDQYSPTIHCFYHLLGVIEKKYVHNEKLNDIDIFYIDWLRSEFKVDEPVSKSNEDAFTYYFNYIDSIIDSYSYIHLNYLIDTYIKPLELRGTKVFYIDSWNELSSKIVHGIPLIKENLIFLKSNDGVLTQSYEQFENSFVHTRIQHEFPKTDNGHPTLIQHKYIAESIIDTIEKFDKEKKIIKLI
jgi:hypothetical protein